jgi:hypothetical protein
MCVTLFFPRGLDPVLDRGPGDKDAVVTPQVPTRGAVGEPILDDEPDGGLLRADRVKRFGQSEVRHIGVEDTPAVRALVLGIADVKIDRASAARVAEVVECAVGRATAGSVGVAAWAAACRVVAAALFDTWRGQILDPRDAQACMVRADQQGSKKENLHLTPTAS